MDQLDLLPRARKVKRMLNSKELYLLTGYVEREYALSGKTDDEFAAAACEMLGVSGLTEANVANCRRVLGLESNRDVKRREKKAAVVNPYLSDDYIQRLQTLEKQVRKLFAKADEAKGGKKLETLFAALDEEHLLNFIRGYFGDRISEPVLRQHLAFAHALFREFA